MPRARFIRLPPPGQLFMTSVVKHKRGPALIPQDGPAVVSLAGSTNHSRSRTHSGATADLPLIRLPIQGSLAFSRPARRPCNRPRQKTSSWSDPAAPDQHHPVTAATNDSGRSSTNDRWT